MEDLLTCIRKTEQLVDIMKNDCGKMNKFVQQKMVKLLHLMSRAPRIKTWDLDLMTQVNSIENNVVGLLTQIGLLVSDLLIHHPSLNFFFVRTQAK
jgi:hypothetical protein